MSDKNKKSSLEEAKFNYEEIRRFAEEQASEKLKEQIQDKLEQLFQEKLNENITINIDGETENVEIKKDGEVVNTGAAMGADVADANLGSDVTSGIEGGVESDLSGDSDEFIVSDEEDEISLDETMEETIQNQNMEEFNKMTMEQDATAVPPTPAPAVDATQVDANAAPVADATQAPVAGEEAAPSMTDLLSKLDTLINVMMQQQGTPADAGEPNAAAGTADQEFQVIDDEAGAAPVADATQAPVAEEIEIVDFETDANKNFIDEMEKQMIEIVDEDNTPAEGTSVDETRGLSFTAKRTGDKTLKMDAMKDEKGHHAPVTSLKENKAQNESATDELIKENQGLKEKIKSYEQREQEFENAFVDLREQFDETQLFNGKLALVNKLLMKGGLSQDEKVKICEQFDSVKTHDEASKLFKKIIKENNIKTDDASTKLKSNTTNTAKPKSTTEPLYESAEARRAKKLAGITKTEDEE